MHAGSMVGLNTIICVLLMEIIGWRGGWLLLGHDFETSDGRDTDVFSLLGKNSLHLKLRHIVSLLSRRLRSALSTE